MPHSTPLLSLAQIHSIYASKSDAQDDAKREAEIIYSRTSFGGREPGHPGHPPPLPESKGKKRVR